MHGGETGCICFLLVLPCQPDGPRAKWCRVLRSCSLSKRCNRLVLFVSTCVRAALYSKTRESIPKNIELPTHKTTDAHACWWRLQVCSHSSFQCRRGRRLEHCRWDSCRRIHTASAAWAWDRTGLAHVQFTVPITTIVIDTMAVWAERKTGGLCLTQIFESAAALARQVPRHQPRGHAWGEMIIARMRPHSHKL